MACGAALAGSLLDLAGSAVAIFSGSPTVIGLPFGNPVFSWAVRMDPLSAYFNVTLAVLAAAVSLYSFGYLRHMEGRRNLGAFGFFFNLLLLSLALVFTASNAFFFLVAWEVMALSAFCLVSFEHEKEEARNAGVLFLIMSHAGTGLLLIAFLLLASASGSLDFSSFHLLASRMPPLQQGAVFLLFFFGFGVKAGIVPLHIWLPEAHPVAPSNVSALMSGIVIKTGIYGMARVFFDFYGPPPLWMGTVVLALGVVSALLGVLYALMEHDLKRLLAYHSIENIGIILMGFGAALMFRALGHPKLAALALIAGAVSHAQSRHLQGPAVSGRGLRGAGHGHAEHGGDGRADPAHAGDGAVLPDRRRGHLRTASAERLRQRVAHLPGAAGRFRHHAEPDALDVPHRRRAAGADRGAGGGLFREGVRHSVSRAAAQRGSRRAREEAPLSMRAGMAILAAGCVALGLGATWFVPVFDPITQQALGVRVSSALMAANGLALSPGTAAWRHGFDRGDRAAVSCCRRGVRAACWRLRWRRRSVTGPAWDCGLPGLTADNEYTATAFSKPLRMIFSALYRPRREIQAEYEVSPYYPKAIRFESEIEPTFEKHIYDPLREWIYRRPRTACGACRPAASTPTWPTYSSR